MNINSQEQQALFTSKLIEGKDEDTARNEIMRDLNFIKDFNQTKRELGRILNSLERDITKRIKKIQSLKFKERNSFKQAFKKDKDKLMNFGANGSHQYANTIILTRVLHYLENNQLNFLECKKIANELCISKNQAENSLRFISKWIRKTN